MPRYPLSSNRQLSDAFWARASHNAPHRDGWGVAKHDWPFLGTEAIASGAVSSRTLVSRNDRIYRNVYMPKGEELTAAKRAVAAWLWAGRAMPRSRACLRRPCMGRNGSTRMCPQSCSAATASRRTALSSTETSFSTTSLVWSAVSARQHPPARRSISAAATTGCERSSRWMH
jgi:hypothetical protein